MHLIESFQDCESFQAWLRQHNTSGFNLDREMEKMASTKVFSNFFGHIPVDALKIMGPNPREHLIINGLNSRQRAILELLSIDEYVKLDARSKIYAPEAITTLSLTMRGRFPLFLGSEFAVDNIDKNKLFPILSEDLQGLSYPSNAFDIVFSCDVLEHVPNIDKSLSEMARVLRPGGLMLSTHPFTWRKNSIVKTLIGDDGLIFIEEPEYHGNPMSEKGSLVFVVPGWDIIERARSAGFSRAEMVIIASTNLAIFGRDPFFINVLRCYK
jgi:SAM-dependent methyltransferase